MKHYVQVNLHLAEGIYISAETNDVSLEDVAARRRRAPERESLL